MNTKEISKDTADFKIAKLRQLNKLIPKLIEASYFNQAKETKKLVIATLKPSQEFMSTVNDLARNHLEKVIEVYKDLALHAYSAGQDKFPAVEREIELAIKDMVLKEQVAAFVKSKYSIDPILCDELCSQFKLNTSKYIETLTGKDKIYAALQKDLNAVYCRAIMDAITLNIKTIKAEISKEKEEKNKKEEISRPKTATEKLEEYAKLLGPKHEHVLRTTLGLPPRVAKPEVIAETTTDKKAYASVNSKTIDDFIKELCLASEEEEKNEEDEELSIEKPEWSSPYVAADLKSTVLELVKSYNWEDESDDFGFVLVDCLIPNASEMSDEDLIPFLKEKLNIISDDPESLDMELEEISAKISAEVGLPGEFLFSEVDDDFCMVFTFTKEAALEMLREKEAVAGMRSKKIMPRDKIKKTIGDLPETEDNLIPHTHQKEIKHIHGLGGQLKNMPMRAIRKASPTLAGLLSSVFAMIRSGKISMGEAAKRFFAASNEALIEEAFGAGGKNYYLYLRGEK